MTDFSDEELTAYLDEELTHAEREAIEQALASDETLAERLRSLDVPLGDIKFGFDAIMADAPRLVLPEAQNTPTNWRLPAVAASILIVGLFLGTLWSALFTQETAGDWKTAVANYQVLYVADTLPGSSPGPRQIEEQLSSVSERLGRDLAGAADVEGLDFRRAQILGLANQPLIQIAYLSENGEPFALCITPVAEDDYSIETERLAGLAASHWVSGGMGYLVIGGSDIDFVLNVAGDIRGSI